MCLDDGQALLDLMLSGRVHEQKSASRWLAKISLWFNMQHRLWTIWHLARTELARQQDGRGQ